MGRRLVLIELKLGEFEYLVSLPSKKLLEEKLHKAITEAKELAAQK